MYIFKSKTIWFSILLALFGSIQVLLPNYLGVLSPSVYGLVTISVSICVALLRAVTTTSLSDK